MPRKDRTSEVLARLAVMDERDRNTAKDIEAIHSTLATIVPLVKKHDQTLYGEDGNNGLKKTVAENRERIIRAEKKMVWFSGAASGAGAFVAFIIRKIFG